MPGPLDPNNQNFQWIDSSLISFLVILAFAILLGGLLYYGQMSESMAYHLGA